MGAAVKVSQLYLKCIALLPEVDTDREEHGYLMLTISVFPYPCLQNIVHEQEKYS